MAGPTRDIVGNIIRLFLNSFKPRRFKGDLRGEDYFGNKYFEIPASAESGKRKPERWFEPVEKDNYGQELPGEWESWLRGRRKEPPTHEELLKNYAIAQMKKRNAAELEAKADIDRGHKIEIKDIKGLSSFPKYGEYEVNPGKKRDES